AGTALTICFIALSNAKPFHTFAGNALTPYASGVELLRGDGERIDRPGTVDAIIGVTIDGGGDDALQHGAAEPRVMLENLGHRRIGFFPEEFQPVDAA